MCPRYELKGENTKALIEEFLEDIPIKLRYKRKEYTTITRASAKHWVDMGFRKYDLQRMQNETMHMIRQKRLRLELED